MQEPFEINEIIDFFEISYSLEQQREILDMLWRVGSAIKDSPLLSDLINKGILQISDNKHIGYRLNVYFAQNNIEKISLKKEFIFSKIPNLKGLHRGKSASYDALIKFVKENYQDLFDEILSDIKVYDFTPAYSLNGRNFTLYLNRKLNLKSNYKYNSELEKYVLKEDEITPLLREHGIKIDVENPEELFKIRIDLNVDLEKMFENKMNEVINEKQKEKMLKIAKITLLVIFWPVGLFYLCNKYVRGHK